MVLTCTKIVYSNENGVVCHEKFGVLTTDLEKMLGLLKQYDVGEVCMEFSTVVSLSHHITTRHLCRLFIPNNLLFHGEPWLLIRLMVILVGSSSCEQGTGSVHLSGRMNN